MIGRAKKKNRFSGDTARMSGVDDVPSEFTSSALSSSSGEQPTQQPPTWFAGLRSKLALFSMSDWFSQLGLGRPATPTRRCSDDVVASAYSNASSPLRQQQQQRARSMGPTVCFDESPATEGEDDPLTPTGDDDVNPWNLPSFWLNLEPGRNYNDTLELQHFGPLDNLVTIGKHAPGQGHTFEQLHLVHPTWCDKCGDFIWGFLKQAVRCENCNYTCHYKCRLLVTLDCRSARDSIKSNETAASYLTAKSTKSQTLTLPNEPNPSDSADDEIDPMDTIDTKSIHQVYVNQDPFEWPEAFQGDRLRKMVQEYNDSADGLSITVHEDGVNFSGYLQIHMNFTRPINVVAGERPPSVYDVINTG
uniref:Phorbol-ester/DAG-type domain-containing protein n=1 Tax=Plectus sambesii TaxID=2011161 RepID=A0A914UWT7_9BILA